MNIIVCVDDRGGMLFHGRRQSRDSAVVADILQETKHTILWVHTFSVDLFLGKNMKNLRIAEDFLEMAQDGDYCFVENADLKPYEDRIDRMVVYRWNRRYPYDMRLGIDVSAWTFLESRDFTGTSHEVITRTVYQRTGEM